MKKNWPFKGIKDQTGVIAGSLIAAGLFIYWTIPLFTPLALAGAGLYALYKVSDSSILPVLSRKYRERNIEKEVKKGNFTPLSNSHPLSDIVSRLSQKMGFEQAPRIYLMSFESIKKEIPWWLKPWTGDSKIRENMKDAFAATPSHGILLTTQEALNKHIDRESLEFITAHELSHLKTDKMSLHRCAKLFLKHSTRALVHCSIAGIALSSLGYTLPVLDGATTFIGAIGSIYMNRILPALALNFSSRRKEFRADRNAIFITRNPKAAERTLRELTASDQDTSLIQDLVHTHPSLLLRVPALYRSFKKAAAYPEPQSTGFSAPFRDKHAINMLYR